MLRFGKLPPKVDYRTLRLGKYLTALAPPPPSFDILPRIYAALGENDPSVLFPMDGNDKLGDCTIAALAHAITIYNGMLGTRQIMATADVIKLYYHLTNGADSGCAELDVLNYWQSNDVPGGPIAAFTSIATNNHAHVQQAISLFGGAYIGFRVQDGADDQFDKRTPWVPGPLTNDGHAVFVTGYDANGLTVLTWGNTQQATWDWWDECVDEAYAILPLQAEQAAWAPGFDFATLNADLQQVAN